LFCRVVVRTLPTGPAIEYERKLEIYIFGLVFLNMTFMVVWFFILDVGPPPPTPWLVAKQKRSFV